MTYEEIVQAVRETYEYSDAREIYEHIAVQINVVGEGHGALYIEVANRQITVEPYEYYDRDVLLVTDADTILAIASDMSTFMDEYKSGKLRVEGNMEKFRQLMKIKLVKKQTPKKSASKKNATKE